MRNRIEFKKIGQFFKNVYNKIGRKNLMVALAILVIGGAVFANYIFFSDPIDTIGYGTGNMADTYGGGEADSTEVVEMPKADEYFATTVLGRQKARDEALEVLQAVVASAEALEDTKAQAFADISQIAKDIENEANIETLIEAKGFSDCVAVLNGNMANIVVKSEGLMQNDIAQINEIVYEQAGILPVNVKIVERQ